MTVKALQEKQSGLILGFDSDAAEVAKLTALGLLPGMTVTVLQRFPSFVLAVGQTHYAIDDVLASRIKVELVG